jgi:ribosomal protein S17E
MDDRLLKNYPKKFSENYPENSLKNNPSKSLSFLINKLIHSQLSEDDSKRLQSEIHPEILFRYNTINILISRKGIGKTFTVMKELIKLSQLPNCGGYSAFIYVSDKTNDETINEMIKLIKLEVGVVKYKDLLQVLYDLIDAKNAYADALEKNITE